MKIVCISDTHGCIQDVSFPEGDVIVHCGDFSNHGTEKELTNQLDFFSNLPYKYKIWIAGNHDLLIHSSHGPAFISKYSNNNIFYLQDSSITINGINFYGTPWTHKFFNWCFMDTEEGLARHYSRILKDTDILLSHGPPFGILDRNRDGLPCGSSSLLKRIEEINPEFHLFGHIHEGYGENYHRSELTTYINCSIVDQWIIHQPIVIEV